MNFKVAEQFALGKFGDQERCDDIVYVSPHYYAIIDGASIGPPVGGKSSGKMIAEAIAAGLADCPAGAGMAEAIRHVNARVRAVFGYADSAEVMRRGPRPAASAAILSVARNEVWAIGDTLLMLDGREIDLTKKIDHATALYRCALASALLGNGTPVETLLSDAPDFQAIKPLLDIQQASFMNRAEQKDFGYANIDGADEVIPLIRVISLGGAKDIVMASDGYPLLHPGLKESEDALALALAEEPTMHSRYPQVKGLRKGQASFDDRAYLRLMRV